MRRRAREDDGATAVEFALVVIPFLVLVIGMIQYGWYFYVSQTTGGAASSVARRLAVGDCWDAGKALALAKDKSPMVDSVTIKDDSGTTLTAVPDPSTNIVVTVTADGSIIGFLPMPNGGDVDKTVETRVEDQTAVSC